jgi:deoxyadenosine/deoxycytidine kinase
MHIAVAGNIGAGKTTLPDYWPNILSGNRIMKMWLTIRI